VDHGEGFPDRVPVAAVVGYDGRVARPGATTDEFQRAEAKRAHRETVPPPPPEVLDRPVGHRGVQGRTRDAGRGRCAKGRRPRGSPGPPAP